MPKKGKKKKTVVLVKTAAKKTSKAKRTVKKVMLKRGPIVTASEMIGSMIAPGIGGHVGRLVGYAGQRLYNHISGSGAYSISKNSLMGVTNVPSFGETTIRMRAREYLGDVSGSIGFLNRPYTINPGDSNTFPWLSSVAVRFQQYELHGLVFEFVSTSSNALSSTNTALGKVVLATSYNVSAPDFTDVKGALITQFANMGKPADNLVHAIECRRNSSTLDNMYVRAANVAVSDPKFYDYGNFQFITEGMQAVAEIGGLWVSYDVSFSKPTLDFSDSDIPSQTYRLPGWSGGLLSGASDPSPGSPSAGILPFNITSVSSFVEILNPRIGDKYFVQIYGSGPSTTAPAIVTTVDGVTEGPAIWHESSSGFGGTTTSCYINSFLEVTSTVPTLFPFVGVSYVLSSAFANGWTGYLNVTRLNPAVPFEVFPGPSMTKMERLIAYSDRKRLELVARPSVEPEGKHEERKDEDFSRPAVAASVPGSCPPSAPASRRLSPLAKGQRR